MKNIHSIEVPCSNDERVLAAVLSADATFVGSMLAGRGGWVYNSKTEGYTYLRTSDPIVGMAFRNRGTNHQTTEVGYVTGENCSAVHRMDINMALHYRPLFHPRAQCLAYSHNQRFLAIGSIDGLVRVYDLQGGESGDPVEFRYSRVSKQGITHIAFNATGNMLFMTLIGGGTLRLDLSDAKSKASPGILDSRDWEIDCLCLATDSQRPLVAFGGFDGRVTVYNYNSRVLRALNTDLGAYVRSLTFLPNNQLAAVGANGLEIWNTDTFKRQFQQLHTGTEQYFGVGQKDDQLQLACKGCHRPLTVV